MTNIHVIDIFIVVAYLVACLTIGLYKSKKIISIKDYALGSSKFSTLVIVSTIFATAIADGSTIGTVEKTYSLGIFFAITRLFTPVFWLLVIWIYGKNINQFSGCLSISDIMENLYGLSGRWLTNIASIFLSIGVIAVQILAIGYIFNYFFGISNLSGVILGIGILTTYSAFGGIRAVAITDVFQFFVFFIAIPTACIFAMQDLGGLSGLVKKLPSSHIEVKITRDNVLLFSSWIFYSIIPLMGGAFVQRFLMAKNSKQLEKSLLIVTAIHLPFIMIVCLIGFIVRANNPEVDPNTALISFIGNYLSTGIKGILIASMLAIIISTADSWLNTSSILCAHDICKKLFPTISNQIEFRIARIATFTIGTMSVLLALTEKGMMELCWTLSNFWEPFILVPLSAGFLKFRTNSKSFIASIISALIFTCFGAYSEGEFAAISLCLGIIGSAIGLFTMHYYQVINRKINVIPRISNISKREGALSQFLTSISFNQFIRTRFAAEKPSVWILTLFVILNYIVPLFVEQISSDIIILSIIGFILCFLLHFISYLPNFLQKYEAYFWYLCLMICCPFLTIYKAINSDYHLLFYIHSMMIMIFMSIFVNWILYIFITILGTFTAYISYQIFSPESMLITSYDIYLVTCCYIIFSIILVIMGKKQKIEIEKKQLLGSAIAHEMQGPFATIQMALETLQEILQSKTNDEDNSKQEIKIDKADYKFLQEISEEVIAISKRASKIITILLTALSGKIIQKDIANYSVVTSINEAIDEYYFLSKQKERVFFNEENEFIFHGSKQFFKHIIFNLMRNSFNYAGENAIIQISLQNNKVYFKDNGIGMDHAKIYSIFDGFQTTNPHNFGVGLAFCHMVMSGMNGKIEFKSEPGLYTEVILSFPVQV